MASALPLLTWDLKHFLPLTPFSSLGFKYPETIREMFLKKCQHSRPQREKTQVGFKLKINTSGFPTAQMELWSKCPHVCSFLQPSERQVFFHAVIDVLKIQMVSLSRDIVSWV